MTSPTTFDEPDDDGNEFDAEFDAITAGLEDLDVGLTKARMELDNEIEVFSRKLARYGALATGRVQMVANVIGTFNKALEANGVSDIRMIRDADLMVLDRLWPEAPTRFTYDGDDDDEDDDD